MLSKAPDRYRRRLAVEDTVKRLNAENAAHGLTPGYKVGFIGDLAYVALAESSTQTRERIQPKPKRERL